ncbi:craniofacial development protein 2 [Tanacetum coccineum]
MCVGRIEPSVYNGNLRLCFPRRGGLGGSRETRRDNRVATFQRIRVGSWNVGSLTGKRLKHVDALARHKVDIACFQETKWKGSSNIEGNGYKLWYSGSPTARNGVGVILKACLKDKVVHVNRCSDRIISLMLVIDGETINVISAYAPQVGLSEVEKKTFWDSLDKVVREFPTDQRLILRGNLNGHIEAATEGYAGVHGGFGYGVRNEEGRAILDFAIAHDLVAVNSYFKKRDHQLVTFQSGGRCTQIDYLLVRRGDLKGSALPKILWKNLIGDATEAFRSRVVEGVSTRVEALVACDANYMWNTLASIIKDAAKETLGVAIGTSKTHTARRESWWLCEEVQAIVAVKQARFRELLSCREDNEEERLRAHERYKEAKRLAKKVVAQAKEKAYEDLYKKLDSKKGANDIFKIAKAQERRRRDLGDIWNGRDSKRVEALTDNHILNATTRGSTKQKSRQIHLLEALMEKYRELKEERRRTKEEEEERQRRRGKRQMMDLAYGFSRLEKAILARRDICKSCITIWNTAGKGYVNMRLVDCREKTSRGQRITCLTCDPILACYRALLEVESIIIKIEEGWVENTHVVVWRNKSDLDTMSIDDLYNNFNIVEQEVKRTVTSNSNSISSSQNMAFVSSPNSTNEVNTTNVQVSTVNSPVTTTK